jgi:hypothetical protein
VSRVDTSIRAAAGVTVVALAGVAGAISYSHMRQLAAGHGEIGWRTHAFPLSVDGVEIVASLVLLADRRTGRRSGWLPWAALVAGTAASVAANVAVSGADPVGRVVAGWPAFALLVAVKLLSELLDHRGVPGRPAVPGTPAATEDRPRIAGRNADTGGDDLDAQTHRLGQSEVTGTGMAAGTVPVVDFRAVSHPASGNERGGDPATGTAPAPDPGTEPGSSAGTIKATRARVATTADAGTGTATDVAALLPVARAARDGLLGRGEPLTRDTLAAQLRRDGHPMRNARVSRLLGMLRAETDARREDGIEAEASTG